jgi:hypothetical protein
MIARTFSMDKIISSLNVYMFSKQKDNKNKNNKKNLMGVF